MRELSIGLGRQEIKVNALEAWMVQVGRYGVAEVLVPRDCWNGIAGLGRGCLVVTLCCHEHGPVVASALSAE